MTTGEGAIPKCQVIFGGSGITNGSAPSGRGIVHKSTLFNFGSFDSGDINGSCITRRRRIVDK